MLLAVRLALTSLVPRTADGRADAVLTGERPTDIEAVRQDLGGDLLGQLGLSGDRLVVADKRVQVAVAGMEHVADLQAGLVGQLPDSTLDLERPQSL